MTERPILLLGVGQVGLKVAAACRDNRKVTGTTRDPKRIFDLFHASIQPIVMPWPSAEIIAPLANDADVLISFPPDGTTDAILAPSCLQANSMVYISSTSVYGSREGTIDDTTPVDEASERSSSRIEAEKIWRSIGANIIRAPGIYSEDSGLHLKLREGKYRIPGDGTRMASRIHIDDLVAIILAIFASGKQQATFVVGDQLPCSHKELVSWLCDQLKIPLPEGAPLAEVHHTLSANRAVDSSRALKELAVQLKYPTYKDGYGAALSLPPVQ